MPPPKAGRTSPALPQQAIGNGVWLSLPLTTTTPDRLVACASVAAAKFNAYSFFTKKDTKQREGWKSKKTLKAFIYNDILILYRAASCSLRPSWLKKAVTHFAGVVDS